MLSESQVSYYFLSKYQKLFCHFYHRITTFIVAVVVYTILCAVLFYTLQWLWLVYNTTLVGQTYIQNSPQSVHLIESILEMNLFGLAFSLILLGSIKGVTLALFGQLLLLTRFTYEHRPLFVKTLLWGIPLATLIANEFVHSSNLTFKAAFLLALFPALVMINPSMYMVKETVPDSKTIYTYLKKRLH
jgi:hypothetical protein